LFCEINIQAGLLEEVVSFPSLTTGEPGTKEVGMSLSLASFEGDEEQGEITIQVRLDLLADIERSICQREELWARLQRKK